MDLLLELCLLLLLHLSLLLVEELDSLSVDVLVIVRRLAPHGALVGLLGHLRTVRHAAGDK